MGADRRSRSIPVVLSLAVVLAAAGCAVAADGGRLIEGSWRLESPLGSVTGPCLVLMDGQTNWRCEIAVAEDGSWPTLQDLLTRRGRGWTITTSGEGGFVQPWSEPWRELGPAAAEAFTDMLLEWTGGRVASVSARPTRRWRLDEPVRPDPVTLDDWAGLPDAWRPPGEGVAGGGELRRRLTTRGRGRGGDGLVLNLRWNQGELEATSARWPGQVTLNRRDAESVEVTAEAYLPLWPLAEFLP